jgi:hypothetical protein
MRASSRLLLVLGLFAAAAQRPLVAETRHPDSPADLVNHLRTIIAGASSRIHPQGPPPKVRPQAIPQGGTPIDLSDLSHPTQIEARLRPALEQKDGALRLTVTDGRAHRGDYSLGSSEDLKGNLLVVDGDADVYGSLRGNLVTVDGDVMVHPGGVVSGDVLTLGGEVRDQAVRSAAKCVPFNRRHNNRSPWQTRPGRSPRSTLCSAAAPACLAYS